jgi:hypothetical protein
VSFCEKPFISVEQSKLRKPTMVDGDDIDAIAYTSTVP